MARRISQAMARCWRWMRPAIAQVDAAWRVVLAHGGMDEGAPGLRAQYQFDYYGAYFGT